MTRACPECPDYPPGVRKDTGVWAGTLTTCNLIWMHSDFFLTAAMPVVKVFRMLVARRRASCEPPSRPAMEPESTVVLPARPRNRVLMTFLPEAGDQRREKQSLSWSSRGYSFSQLLGNQTTPEQAWPGAWVVWAGAGSLEKSPNSEKRKPG